MANRTLFRTILLQALYEWDIRGMQNEAIPHYLEYTLRSFNGLEEDMEETLELAQGVGKKQSVIDEIILKAAPDWPLSKISLTDRNVLRLGLYELLFGDHDNVPPKVAINEAVELAKRFGGPKSNKFVNGILGAVYREIGEPGKEQTTKAKMPEVAYEDMPIDQKGSAVVYSIDQNEVIRIGMVHDIFGYWTLSKGGIEEGETPEQGTIREVKEETDWDMEIIQELGDNEYIAYHPQRGPVRKQVQYFLGKSAHTKPTLEVGSGGLDDVRWFELREIPDLNIYEDVSQMLIKSIGIITGSDTAEESIDEIAQEDLIDISKMKVPELKALAKEHAIEGYEKMKKSELLKALL